MFKMKLTSELTSDGCTLPFARKVQDFGTFCGYVMTILFVLFLTTKMKNLRVCFLLKGLHYPLLVMGIKTALDTKQAE